MDREQAARKKYNSGYSCASAVYSAFNDVVSGASPIPRSEGGKCGAVLAAEKVLRQLGYNSQAFDQQFVRQFGSLKCDELRRPSIPITTSSGLRLILRLKRSTTDV